LHEKVSSVKDKIENKNLKKIRWIATMRNKTFHEDGFQIDNINDFLNSCNEVIEYLSVVPSYSNNNSSTYSKRKSRNKPSKSLMERWSPLNIYYKIFISLLFIIIIAFIILFWEKILGAIGVIVIIFLVITHYTSKK